MRSSAPADAWIARLQEELNSSDGVSVKVKAGDLLGYMKSTKSPHGVFDLDFETWAANYNVEPPANGIH